MRFLLHPVVVKSRAKASGRQALTAVVKQPGSTTQLPVTAPSPLQAAAATTSWGQQCSPNCGCVLRFEATTCIETDRILSASYTAKQLLLDAQGHVQLTNRSNRPMMTDCTCPSLHHLATAVVDQFLQGSPVTWQRFKSQLDFSATRSSPSFAKAALQSQSLPHQTTGCFDLVEEALTGMVKGYLPKPRRPVAAANKMRKQMVSDDDHDTFDSPMEDEGHFDASSALDFTLFAHPNHTIEYPQTHSSLSLSSSQHQDLLGSFWNKASAVEAPSRQTMLEFVDEQHAKLIAMRNAKQSSSNAKKVPTDWVDYVDRLWQEQQQQRGEATTTRRDGGGGRFREQQQSA